MFCKPVMISMVLCIAGCSALPPGTYVPPVTITPSFFGAQVAIQMGGYTVPVKVVPTAAVVVPTLMVPPVSPITKGSLPVTNDVGQTATVPVTVAPVIEPVLAVPVANKGI